MLATDPHDAPIAPAGDLRGRLLRLRQSSGTSPTPRAGTPQPPATTPLPSLAERIERMRQRAITGARTSRDTDLARLTNGHWLVPQLLEVERRLPLQHVHGRVPLAAAHTATPGLLESLGAATRDPERLAFFDTETSGLAGGTGTVVFLIGFARFEGDALRIRQLLITGFAAESALIEAVRAFVTSGTCLVSYNGKSFDAPLVRTRARLLRAADPLGDAQHIDLLHLVRRRFRREWPDCRLRTAEARALGFARVDDLPGHLVPEAFRRFIRFGESDPLPQILAHNRHDLVSLAALLHPLAQARAD
jgi:uncharacterized protein YprB with RNaseH-like and TPR domain